MFEKHDNQRALDHELALSIGLNEVPNTKVLQANIVEITRDMPQQLDVNDDAHARVLTMPSFVKRVMPFAVAASLALFVFTAFPDLFNQGAGLVNDQVVDGISIEELEFQEAMLLHDEWLFAQL